MNAALMLLAIHLPAQPPAETPLQPIPQVRLRLDTTEEQHPDDPILLWNEVALQAIRRDRTSPPMAARGLAMLHAAMFDAVNSVSRTHQYYLIDTRADPGTSAKCAAVVAAHRVLHALHPNQRQHFDNLLDRAMVGHPDEDGKEAGVRLGSSIAEKVLAWRENDGSEGRTRHVSGSAPGEWQPTLPDYAPALLPRWGRQKPFTARSLDRFRPRPPPALTSREYTASFREVRDLGGIDSRLRTAEQTEIALFWADGEGTVTPPGHWNRIAQTVSRQRGLSLEENARLFALLNLAMADASIGCWECKFRFNVWRPVQAIREADRDDNPDTVPDPGWRPLLKTPPFPAYTSGHSSFSGAAAAVLACFFENDRVRFTTTSDGLPNVTRLFNSFSAAAQEAGQSRIYGGIHYQFDNVQGLETGRTLGNYVCRSLLQPR